MLENVNISSNIFNPCFLLNLVRSKNLILQTRVRIHKWSHLPDWDCSDKLVCLTLPEQDQGMYSLSPPLQFNIRTLCWKENSYHWKIIQKGYSYSTKHNKFSILRLPKDLSMGTDWAKTFLALCFEACFLEKKVNVFLVHSTSFCKPQLSSSDADEVTFSSQKLVPHAHILVSL